MRRTLILAAAAAAAIGSLGGCGAAGTESEISVSAQSEAASAEWSVEEQAEENSEAESIRSDAEAAEQPVEADETDSIRETEPVHIEMGEYELSITGAEYLSDYYYEPAVVISFVFTNHGSEFACAYNAFRFSAYQNDEKLSEDTYYDRGTEMANLNSEVKDGNSVACKIVYRPRTMDNVSFHVQSGDLEETAELPISTESVTAR